MEIVPVLNKIDLPAADVDRVKLEIEEVVGLDTSAALHVSAKTGVGVESVLQALIDYVPPPEQNDDAPLRALIFDSWYDNYRGVIVLIRVVDGVVKKGTKIYMKATEQTFDVLETGVFTPHACSVPMLRSGDVGFVIANIKDVRHAQVGDTIVEKARAEESESLSGFKQVTPVVFSSLSVNSSDYPSLRA